MILEKTEKMVGITNLENGVISNGMTVEIINTGSMYEEYTFFFEFYNLDEIGKRYANTSSSLKSHKCCSNDRKLYQVIGSAYHTGYPSLLLYIIQNANGEIGLIGENGIKICMSEKEIEKFNIEKGNIIAKDLLAEEPKELENRTETNVDYPVPILRNYTTSTCAYYEVGTKVRIFPESEEIVILSSNNVYEKKFFEDLSDVMDKFFVPFSQRNLKEYSLNYNEEYLIIAVVTTYTLCYLISNKKGNLFIFKSGTIGVIHKKEELSNLGISSISLLTSNRSNKQDIFKNGTNVTLTGGCSEYYPKDIENLELYKKIIPGLENYFLPFDRMGLDRVIYSGYKSVNKYVIYASFNPIENLSYDIYIIKDIKTNQLFMCYSDYVEKDYSNRTKDDLKLIESVLPEDKREEIKNEMEKMLSDYNWKSADEGINELLNTWAERKSDLINLMKKHPNYNGNYQIVLTENFNRNLDSNSGSSFANFWFNHFSIDCSIKHFTIPALTKTEDSNIDIKDIEDNCYLFLTSLRGDFCEETLSSEEAEKLNEIVKRNFKKFRVAKGQKTSRAINKACLCYKMDLWERIENVRHTGENGDIYYLNEPVKPYQREFAKYADGINPLIIQRYTILSCNPIDYLTMSFGNSWSSCHTIDKRNIRHRGGDTYQGMHCSGTVSYLTDSTSLVLYTIDRDYDGNTYELEDKINRNMFHWGNNKLMQGRVYPQGNDGAGSTYRTLRLIVQRVFAECLGIPNLWKNEKGTETCDNYVEVGKRNTAYPDWKYQEDCNISFPSSLDRNEKKMIVGAETVCIECGTHNSCESDEINCCSSYCGNNRCYECGWETEYAEDLHYIDGEYYCEDCCFYCDYHEEWEIGGRAEGTNVLNYGVVCESGLENGEFEQCKNCGEWYYTGNGSGEILGNGSFYCGDCLEECFTYVSSIEDYVENDLVGVCDICGECFLITDLSEDKNGDFYCDSCYEDIKKEQQEHQEDKNEEIA